MGARWPDEPPVDFPTHVKIGRRIFKVQYVTDSDPSVKDGESYCLGTMNNSEDLISVVLSQTVPCMRNTALHEAVHGFYAHHGMGGAECDEDEEERVVCWVTDVILALEESGWLKVNF